MSEWHIVRAMVGVAALMALAGAFMPQHHEYAMTAAALCGIAFFMFKNFKPKD